MRIRDCLTVPLGLGLLALRGGYAFTLRAARQVCVLQRSRRGAPGERELYATLIWSVHESALKALRQGLRLDTREVEVILDADEFDLGWGPLESAIALAL